MKSNIKRHLAILIAMFVGMVEVANAFYDPGLQRWINRDPLGDAKSTPVLNGDNAPWIDRDEVDGDESVSVEMMRVFIQVNQNLQTFGLECDAELGPGSLNPENLTALDSRTAAEIAQSKLKRATLDAIQKSKSFGNGLKGSRNIDISKLRQALNRDQLQKAKEIAQNAVRAGKERLKQATTDKARQKELEFLETQLNRARACKQALSSP